MKFLEGGILILQCANIIVNRNGRIILFFKSNILNIENVIQALDVRGGHVRN